MGGEKYEYRKDSEPFAYVHGRNVVDATTGRPGGYDDEDVFGHEEGHDVCAIIE